MAHGFKTLVEFLEEFTGEVEGRARTDPPDEVRAKLRAFARGELTEAEREELVHLLKENPQWASLLADEIKALRPNSGSEAGNP